MQFPGWDFIDKSTDSMAVLPNHYDCGFIFHGNDRRSAGMRNDLQLGGCSIRECHGFNREIDDAALKNGFLHSKSHNLRRVIFSASYRKAA